ncbi:MAG: T9SS type A sorting domain-containing protein [Flavobacteriales bacterium]
MRHLLLSVCAVFASAGLWAQSTFIRTYQWTMPMVINGGDVTPDGGFVLCGYAPLPNDSIGVVLRMDPQGNVGWMKAFSGGDLISSGGDVYESFTSTAFLDIVAHADGGFSLSGVKDDNYYYSIAPLFLGLDSAGEPTWGWAHQAAATTSTHFPAIEPNASGDLLMVGSYWTINGAFGFAARFDVDSPSVNNLTMQDVVGPGGALLDGIGTTLDGGVVSMGGSNGTVEYLVRYDSLMNLLWQIPFETTLPFYPVASTQGPDSSIYGVLRSSGGTFALVKATSGGSLLWAKEVDPGHVAVPTAICVREDGTVVVGGNGAYAAPLDSNHVFIAEFSPDGDFESGWWYQADLSDFLRVKTMRLLDDGGTYLAGTAGYDRAMLIRADSTGYASGCAQIPLVASVTSTTWLSAPSLQVIVPTQISGYRAEHVVNSSYLLATSLCGGQQTVYTARGALYHDSNSDGFFGTDETGLAWQPVNVAPSIGWLFTLADGTYSFLSNSDGTYAIMPPSPAPWWALSSDSAEYHPTFTTADTLFEDLDFGYAALMDTTILVLAQNGGYAACASPYSQVVHLSNMGTTTPQGVVSFELDTAITILGIVPPIDSLVGTTLYWHFDSLACSHQWHAQILLDLAQSWNTGTVVHGEALVWADDGFGTLAQVGQLTANRLVGCAFDPNNKVVLEEELIPADQQWLTYTINFQNTGTDTAHTVVLEDQLSQYLQWNTLQFLGSTHNLSALSINTSGKATFTFNNIMLPDSGADEPASHGSLSYRVSPQPGLVHGTWIENNAGIFFDLNTAVVTNTVRNMLVDCATATHWPIWTTNFNNGIFAGTSIFDTLTYNYQWYLDGLAIPGAVGTFQGGSEAYVAATASGTYTIELTDEFGCVSLSDPFPFIITAVGAVIGPHITVLPNPFTTATRILCNEVLDANTRIDLVDVHGRSVRTIQGNGTREVLIERGDLRSGLYTVRVMEDAGMRAAVRIVVE